MSDTPSTRDKIIADAKSLPDLIASAQVYDPSLAQSLTGKALVASKSVYGPFAAAVVSWAVTHYGLGWDASTCASISGGLVLLVSAAVRSITSGPITGLFHKTPIPAVVIPASAIPTGA